jgi:anti-repressor protein
MQSMLEQLRAAEHVAKYSMWRNKYGRKFCILCEAAIEQGDYMCGYKDDSTAWTRWVILCPVCLEKVRSREQEIEQPFEQQPFEVEESKMAENTGMEIVSFDFNGNPIQVIMDEQGKPWWVAREVCAVLGFRMASDATRLLDDDEKGTHIVRTLGGMQKMIIINEPGLYSLILRSRKPEAKAFKRWVTHDVLPSIRKTGGYIHGTKEMTDAEIMAKALLVAQKTIEQREKSLNAANAAIRVLHPKAEVYDNMISSRNLYTFGDFAKIYTAQLDVQKYLDTVGETIGSQKVGAFFKQRGYVMKRKINTPYQATINNGWMVVKPTGTEGRPQTFLTAKGVEHFCKVPPGAILNAWKMSRQNVQHAPNLRRVV